jgi:anaerobic magnesium-protoporphyrin IX monomethyl ester cyclase
MRVALAYPLSKGGDYSCNPPLSLLYLATSLKANGFEVSVFDLDSYTGGMQELLNDIVDYRPVLVGIPIFTITTAFKATKAICRGLRKSLPDVLILAGGPHPTALPEQTLEWFPELDFVLQGECDYTLCDLVAQIDNNVAKPSVPGLFQRTNGAIEGIERGDPPKDLDSVPIPDRKIIWNNYQKGVYWRLDRKGATDLLITGRGCPFNCKFCFKTESLYRRRSAENVVQELEYLSSLGITAVDFEDDLFTANRKRCVKICQLIREAGLNLDLKVRSRVDTIDEEILDEMRRSGVKAIVFGIESGSQRILAAMGKKTSVERNFQVIQMAKKAGMRCHADILIGYPGEDAESLAETKKFLLKARPTSMLLSIMTPFPCTQVYDDAKADGSIVGEWSLDGRQPYIKLDWMKDYSTLCAEYNKIYRSYYSHPAILLGMMKHAPKTLRVWKKGARFIWRKLNH